MGGEVIVHNDTGHPLHAVGCLSPFAVALANAKIVPTVAFPTCAQPFTVPIGRSSWHVTVRASYLSCGSEERPCIGGHPPVHGSGGHPPGLPPGHYRAKLYQNPHIVPAPAPIPVRVTR